MLCDRYMANKKFWNILLNMGVTISSPDGGGAAEQYLEISGVDGIMKWYLYSLENDDRIIFEYEDNEGRVGKIIFSRYDSTFENDDQ